jgi:TAG lipase / steryl ester hydrolase / phospholipase A2 / LPA acyltransferase
MSEKVTAYDLSYLQNNPFGNITAAILLKNAERVGVNLDARIDDNVREIGYRPTEEEGKNKKSSTFTYFHYFKDKLLSILGKPLDATDIEIEKLQTIQKYAITYDEWYDVSLKLDQIQNNDSWKDVRETDLYDYEAVEEQLQELQKCREEKDFDKLLYIIRTRWKRDFAGVNNERLYRRCHVGTKTLITQYIEECVMCLELLVSDECPMDDEYILEVLLESKRNYGRTAMTMSGGGAFGLVGLGVFSTLLETNLFPKVISGSSGGSIVSSIMCSKNSDEIKSILSDVFDHTFEVFDLENDNDTFYTHLSRLLKYGVWFDSKNLQQTMKEFLGNITFKEAYNKTGRILNITVSPATVHDQPTLLNYLTAPNVLIWSAVCASCSLPVVFASSTIYERNLETGEIHEWSNSSLKFVDGSLNSDLPISRLSEMFNVNHTIACQVNPHITPIVRFSAECKELADKGNLWNLKRLFYDISSIISLELSHYCDILRELGIATNLVTKLRQMMVQSYTGDITILPELNVEESTNFFLVNPTPNFMWKCVLKGARATWKKLSLIKDQYTVEYTMDKYISVLKSRVVFDTRDGARYVSTSSTSCTNSPEMRYQLSLLSPNPPHTQHVNFSELRKPSETITVSEKHRYEDGVSPFSSRVNGHSNNYRAKRNLKHESISPKSKEKMNSRPDHSFESLRNAQRRGKEYTISKNRHSKSFSYTQIPNDDHFESGWQEEVIIRVGHDSKRRGSGDTRITEASAVVVGNDSKPRKSNSISFGVLQRKDSCMVPPEGENQ